LNRS
jgi:shikimate kinase